MGAENVVRARPATARLRRGGVATIAGLGLLALAVGPALAQAQGGVQTDIFQGGRGAAIPGVTVPHQAPPQSPAPERKAEPKRTAQPKKPAEPKKAAAKPSTGKTKAAIPVSYDKQLSAQIQSQFLEQVKAQNPQSAEQVKQQLDERSAEDRFADDLKTYGFSINDMGDVATGHMLLMWMIANKAEAPGAQAAQAVRAQIRKSLMSDPNLGKDSAQERQLKAERIIYDALMRISAFNQLKRAADPSQLQQFSDQTRDDFQKAQQIDLRTLKLTDQGFAEAQG